VTLVKASVILKKISNVRHNLSRLASKRDIRLEMLRDDPDTQDIVLHNLQLAIQGCIDIGSHIISDEGWGVAGSLNEIFYILQDKGVINSGLVERMASMVGFRNILVHEYEDVDMDIVHEILQTHLKDVDAFLLAVVDYFKLG